MLWDISHLQVNPEKNPEISTPEYALDKDKGTEGMGTQEDLDRTKPKN